MLISLWYSPSNHHNGNEKEKKSIGHNKDSSKEQIYTAKYFYYKLRENLTK